MYQVQIIITELKVQSLKTQGLVPLQPDINSTKCEVGKKIAEADP